ncbi:endo alpha-1,4 polygalactosaminidase [Actinotalea sp. BY-33]|uniref:Endo alpha-1,4 polygalactosaminidase n=1 Tax=Actinotalea soli TaxID=2819234 RepID=A0A939LT60_9CELL|nr:endo alpha-1,4 polygalactosaminidase [Actinotalea soli]MBO1750872.1 endo alpha-1,4 polygalactosaminidase [Actinotalea soli]
MRSPRLLAAGAALVVLLALVVRGESEPRQPVPVVLPPADQPFDYQLGGAHPPPPEVQMVVRDSTEPALPGYYSVCYVNGFQTQPGADWPERLVVHDTTGRPVVDPDWPDEQILDLSTADRRDEVAARVQRSVDACAAAGYDAVELDNLDSYTRAQGAFGLEESVALATALTEHAHGRGLAVGQKNTPELGSRGPEEIGFDFAVTEQCDRYDECDVYAATFGSQVYDVEYEHDLRGTADAVCARAEGGPSTIVRDLGLVPAGSPGYAYRAC